MPEYLAPGVYVEEVSFRSKSIEGVSTTTTGFIGPARYGPVNLEPDLVTSLGEFERIYGDGQQLVFKDQAKPLHNYLWHAARGFFEEGGKRLYVVRTFRAHDDPADPSKGYAGVRMPGTAKAVDLPGDPDPVAQAYPDDISIRARFPGALGKLRLRLSLSLGQNLLGSEEIIDPASGLKKIVSTARALQDCDVVWISDIGSPIASLLNGSPPGQAGRFYVARREFDTNAQADVWFFYDADGMKAFDLNALQVEMSSPVTRDEIRVVTLTVTVYPTDPFGQTQVWTALPLDPNHKQVGTSAKDSLAQVFAEFPTNRALAYRLPIVVTLGEKLSNGVKVLNQLFAYSAQMPGSAGLEAALMNTSSTENQRAFEVVFTGGDDGDRPTATEYEGDDNENLPYKTGLKAFEDIEDISIVAAPGATYGFENGYNADARTINSLLISHAQRMRYRIAVLDSGDAQTLAQVRAMRAKVDSKYAALYYPWVRVLDPITRSEIYLPPSGFITGIYARNDVNRAVYKAPANEVINLALGFEQLLNKSQQDVLNPEGINCLRFFEGRGFLVWGARTVSSDPEWKYVNLRRYFAYLERSIDRGSQWAVFEPNGEALWANVRRTIEDFLLNEWQNGALLGDKPEKAYFVKCDRTTMTQNDLDNGRLVCLIGVAPLRPAEFVIFRIGQWTADRKV